jgi:zinc transport system substrate-binding protein
MHCRIRQLRPLSPARIWHCAALLLAVGLTVLLLVACRPGPPGGTPETRPAAGAAPEPQTGDRLRVFVSIPPQGYFVQRVGDERVQVEVLVGPGQNPHSYEATPAQVTSLAKARVFFRIGMPFEEALLPRLHSAFRQLEIVDTRQGVPLRRMEEHENAHGGEASRQDEEGDDPHIWLNPRLVKIQARTIADTLIRLDPAHADEYRRNLAAFDADLDALDARIAAALAPVRGRNLFVYHPAFGYFADAYGLHQVPVEVAGKEPTPQDLAELIRRARQEDVRVIFVQPQFSTRSAEIIARQIKGAVVPLDDLAPDYMKSMQTMANQVRQALSGPASASTPVAADGSSAVRPASRGPRPTTEPSVQP